MYAETLRAVARARGLNQSDLARIAGVSRQAVSLWLQQHGEVNVQLKHARRLARGLRVPLETLLEPLPLLGDERESKAAEAALLWDRLYPDLPSFVAALI
ncbi:MAG: XRE family transcriptional regulator, partial [Deltaproteobacteria bacterium]